MATKQAFLDAYQRELLARYEWARDGAKLGRFMSAVEKTLTTSVNKWNNDGDAVTAAWRSIGMKGKPTYKALRSLAT